MSQEEGAAADGAADAATPPQKALTQPEFEKLAKDAIINDVTGTPIDPRPTIFEEGKFFAPPGEDGDGGGGEGGGGGGGGGEGKDKVAKQEFSLSVVDAILAGAPGQTDAEALKAAADARIVGAAAAGKVEGEVKTEIGGRRRTKRKGRKGSKKSKKGAKKSKKSSQSNQSQNGGRSRKNRRKHSRRRKH
jgi:hypothetical protein